MITCPRCGGRAPDDAQYCPYCGYGKQPPMPTQNTPADPPQMVPDPNQQNTQNHTAQKPPKAEPNHERSCFGCFFAVMIIALVFFIVLIILTISRGISESKKSKPTEVFSPSLSVNDILKTAKTAEALPIFKKTPEPAKTAANIYTSVQETITSYTDGNSKALSQAKSYLQVMAFSRKGLIDQLKFEGYSQSESEFAADNCGADWYEQAALKAESYISAMSFSIDNLVEQLEFEGFSHDEAVHGANATEINESEQAIAKAKAYLSFSNFSKKGLIDQLMYDGFSNETAAEAVDQINVNWNEQARGKAESYLELMNYSYDDLISQLEYEGFTHDQAVYGAVIIK